MPRLPSLPSHQALRDLATLWSAVLTGQMHNDSSPSCSIQMNVICLTEFQHSDECDLPH